MIDCPVLLLDYSVLRVCSASSFHWRLLIRCVPANSGDYLRPMKLFFLGDLPGLSTVSEDLE